VSDPQFDPEKFTKTAREQWNKAADDWHKWMDTLSDWIAPVTTNMFDLANIDSGHRVLDVAAGDGDQSMMAAKRVGDEGYVLATDLSANLVNIIRENAAAAGLSNLEAQEMNGENLEAIADDSFDIVISRLGLMLFPNPLKGLKEMHRVLKPGGRKVALVFTTPDNSPCLSGPAMIAMRHAQMPPPQPGQPGLFALGAPGMLEKKFQEAGFQNVETRIISTLLTMDSAIDCRKFLLEAGGFYRSLLSKLDDEAQQATVNEIDEYLQQFETPDGFVSPTEVIMAVGTK
jgi:ubiquinone/menaquinone biosynthesis C-methylase UbiE